MKLLQDKKIVLGVTGGIAAYKAVEITSLLKKQGATVDVIMTKNAMEFVTPLTFQTISENKVYTDTFQRIDHFDVEHISLAKKADLFLLAPATMNVIGKIRAGIADDMVTTVIAATKAQKLIVPAMNTAMYENPILQQNMKDLMALGMDFMEPVEGLLACGDVGKGKFPSPMAIVERVIDLLYKKDLKGKKLLITAGPTREIIDPVRFISNKSTGKMGYDIAYAAKLRGADVTLVSGPVAISPPMGVKVISVTTANEMKEACLDLYPTVDAVIKTAAVGDYRPETTYHHKVKKNDDDMAIALTRNDDILKKLGETKENQILIGFAAESQNVEAYAKKKLTEKNLDMIVANNVLSDGAGFGGETNIVDFYYPDGTMEKINKMDKNALGFVIIDRLVTLFK